MTDDELSIEETLSAAMANPGMVRRRPFEPIDRRLVCVSCNTRYKDGDTACWRCGSTQVYRNVTWEPAVDVGGGLLKQDVPDEAMMPPATHLLIPGSARVLPDTPPRTSRAAPSRRSLPRRRRRIPRNRYSPRARQSSSSLVPHDLPFPPSPRATP